MDPAPALVISDIQDAKKNNYGTVRTNYYGSESEMPKNLRVLRIAPEHLHEQVRF